MNQGTVHIEGRGKRMMPGAIVKCALVTCALLVVLQSASAQTRIRVEFAADDQCVVSTSSGESRANMIYPRRTTELRCAVPSLSPASVSDEVELEVVLPPGRARPVDAFPRLEWTKRDGRWRGTGRLDGVPAFVRVAPDWGLRRWRAYALDLTVILATGLAIAWSVVRGRRS